MTFKLRQCLKNPTELSVNARRSVTHRSQKPGARKEQLQIPKEREGDTVQKVKAQCSA